MLFSFYSAVLECVVLVGYILSDVILVVTAVVFITPVVIFLIHLDILPTARAILLIVSAAGVAIGVLGVSFVAVGAG